VLNEGQVLPSIPVEIAWCTLGKVLRYKRGQASRRSGDDGQKRPGKDEGAQREKWQASAHSSGSISG
jgi:hypothetical protein